MSHPSYYNSFILVTLRQCYYVYSTYQYKTLIHHHTNPDNNGRQSVTAPQCSHHRKCAVLVEFYFEYLISLQFDWQIQPNEFHNLLALRHRWNSNEPIVLTCHNIKILWSNVWPGFLNSVVSAIWTITPEFVIPRPFILNQSC